MASYDLRSEPWIPIRFIDGGIGKVGLEDALARAHEISEIALDSPIETVALNRLLLALAVRIFAETSDREAWCKQWKAAAFDDGRIAGYFEQWKDRFDLLHPARPFYQVREMPGEKILPVGMLRLDESNKSTELFSHGSMKTDATIPLDAAARGIVASQLASIGGLQCHPFRYGRNAPFVTGALFWLRGASLLHSLLLNAPPLASARMYTTSADGDLPVWEREDSIRSEPRPVQGFLDYLTFQHSRMTLETTESDSGEIKVHGARITAGDSEDPSPMEDPHMAIVQAGRDEPIRRYNLLPEKALWRDTSIFMTTVSGTGAPPATFTWLSSNRDMINADQFRIEVFSIRTRSPTNGMVRLWRRESMPFFGEFLENEILGSHLKSGIDRVEDQAKILWHACFTTAKKLLFASKEDSDLSPDDRNSAKTLVRTIDADTRYWASLEQSFYQFLHALSGHEDPEETVRLWTGTVHRKALAAFDAATSSMVASGRQLRAVAEGRAVLRASRSYRTNTPSPLIESEETSNE